MENAPLDTDSSPESDITGEKPRDKKKRRKSLELGRAAVDVNKESPSAPAEAAEPPKSEKGMLDWFKSEADKESKPDMFSEFAAQDSADVEKTAETENTPEHMLSPEEEKTVIRAIAHEEAANVPEHNAEKELEEAAGDMLVAEFYDRLKHDPDIEKAASEAADEAGIELPPEYAAILDEEFAPAPNEELVFDRSAGELPSEAASTVEDEDFASLAADPAATTSIASGRATPAAPPLHPGSAAGGPGLPPHGPGLFAGGPTNFNYAPPMPTPNAPPPASRERLDRQGSPAVFFVAGGIVGYLMGKRRWKKKGKEETNRVRKELTKQVEDLGWQIKTKESQIRRIAAEKVRQDGPAVVEALAATRAAKSEMSKPQMPAVEAISIKPEAIREIRQKAPEAQHLHAPKAPERIAQVLTASEALPAAPVLLTAEQLTKKPDKIKQINEKPAPALSEKSVETLSRAELLQMSERIMVEGSSLRQIYETNLLGERGLRRLVAEHLRGGDLTKALRQEITEREIDFERDPAMRDLAPVGQSQTGGNSGGTAAQSTLDQMVQQAAAKLPAAHEEAAFYKAKAAYEVEQSSKHRQRQQVIDASFGGVIVVLLAAVIYLFITRG